MVRSASSNMKNFFWAFLAVLSYMEVSSQLLGAGTGTGSCRAFPYRVEEVDWEVCPVETFCCNEYGYCRTREEWNNLQFRDCNGKSNGIDLPGAVLNQEAALGGVAGESLGAEKTFDITQAGNGIYGVGGFGSSGSSSEFGSSSGNSQNEFSGSGSNGLSGGGSNRFSGSGSNGLSGGGSNRFSASGSNGLSGGSSSNRFSGNGSNRFSTSGSKATSNSNQGRGNSVNKGKGGKQGLRGSSKGSGSGSKGSGSGSKGSGSGSRGSGSGSRGSGSGSRGKGSGSRRGGSSSRGKGSSKGNESFNKEIVGSGFPLVGYENTMGFPMNLNEENCPKYPFCWWNPYKNKK